MRKIFTIFLDSYSKTKFVPSYYFTLLCCACVMSKKTEEKSDSEDVDSKIVVATTSIVWSPKRHLFDILSYNPSTSDKIISKSAPII